LSHQGKRFAVQIIAISTVNTNITA